MDKKDLVLKTFNFVKETLKNADASHDFWHIQRVYNNAIEIAKTEECDIFVVKLGALLHDIADYKYYGGDEQIGPRITKEFLMSQDIDDDIVDKVENIVRYVSFKGGKHKCDYKSIELDIVQDADRLDAIGAIGIARCIAYSAENNRELYNPEIEPNLDMTSQEYINNSSSAINHFYEKLLLLKEKMNTKTARKIAENRHSFMEKYLEQFFAEWEGKR